MRYNKLIIKLLAIKNINKSIYHIYDIIYGIMNRINDSYRNNLISKHKYNIHLQNLENIVSQYDSVSNYLISI